ncbi:ATP-dependent helicase HrpB [Paenibacillus turpanensis]|uniref:ATP-dependent helicase HrpB n=1 Tax=Paenibacillus turpanensis TaxID=2689078 RepID=UPI00140D36EB|nr:ATP-dependent helicase HrpB [Paenibacillus turpanensis]
MSRLPIEDVIGELQEALRSRSCAVLVAPPGAGKTTRVPLALLEEPWLAGKRIVILEPRRLAARSAARFMAALLGEQVGGTVGYRVRSDTKVGPSTRIEVVTEGVLTRMLQSDQALEQVGAVLFDEFHERHLHGDLGLALCLQSQELLREDLRLVVMSATLDAEPVARLLGEAPIIVSEGRMYPVETRYAERSMQERVETAAARKVREALAAEPGDVLVFLPGAGEIRRTAEELLRGGGMAGVRVAQLYGNMPLEEQDRALAPCAKGERKVVLATSIAETSLTVEGVRVVIDAGLMRVQRFSPRTGMSRLETVPVSKASADQRRGRAGRVAPGVCYRLWTEGEHRFLPEHHAPEIAEADLAPLALELAAWGANDPAELRWLDEPPQAAYAQALELLQRLGALAADGSLTPYGRRMAALGAHPRLAHMLLQAVPLGLGGLACELAALLGERDVLRGVHDADMRLRLDALRGAPHLRERADEASLRRAATEAARWRRELGVPAGGASPGDAERSGLLLAYAFPDRVGQRRESGGRFLLSGGRGAVLPGQQPLAAEEYIVAVELDDSGTESRIQLAAACRLAELEEHFGAAIQRSDRVFWDRESQTVRGRRQHRLGALLLKDAPLPELPPEAAAEALLEGVAAEGLTLLQWTKAARALQARLVFMKRQEPEEWPAADDDSLLRSLREWLLPQLYGMRSRADLQRLNLAQLLEAMLPWEQRRRLDDEAPTHLVIPSGSRIPIDYSDPDAPALNVRLQELFGLAETPRIGGGRVPITMHLLSPAQRPVQITRDLRSFWNHTYFEIKKDLKGRYPKHYWPDDPWNAAATSRVRPKPT